MAGNPAIDLAQNLDGRDLVPVRQMGLRQFDQRVIHVRAQPDRPLQSLDRLLVRPHHPVQGAKQGQGRRVGAAGIIHLAEKGAGWLEPAFTVQKTCVFKRHGRTLLFRQDPER
ncbi:hypothetical protein GCM10027396_03680 [Insolitispirillum peregrinum]